MSPFSWLNLAETKAQDRNLTAVPVHFSRTPTENPRQGTKLVISNLREPEVWLGNAQDTLVSQLSQLIFPFADVRPFNVYLTINGARIDLETITESLRDLSVSRFVFSFNGGNEGKLSITGRVRLNRLRGLGERAEFYHQYVEQDQGQEFFAYLTNPENPHNFTHAEYLGEDGWFISFKMSTELRSLGNLAMISGEVADPGKFNGEIDEFFFRGVNLDPLEDVFSKAADYRDLVKSHVGIRIYRDGFGIRPYGLDGKDWMNLAGGQTSGLSYYSIRPNNVIGYVSLSAKENSQLKEKTDREGFVDSPHSRNFFRIIDELVNSLGRFFNSLGRSYSEYRKKTSEQAPGFLPPDTFATEAREIAVLSQSVEQHVSKLDQGLDELTKSVEDVVDRAVNAPLLASEEERQLSPMLADVSAKFTEINAFRDQLKSLLKSVKSVEPTANAVQAKISVLEEQLTEFSELAGLGLTAEALSHEIHAVADRLAERTRALTETLKRRNIINAQIISYTEYVHSAISTLRKQLSHLAPSLRYVREQKDSIDLEQFFVEMKDFYASRFKKSGIRMELVKPFEDFTITINRGKLTQVIDNIILNADYWLREGVRRGEISNPTISIRSKRPHIAIYDNGIGVEPSVESSLFQPFVTTKPKKIGRGLGLFIVRELLNSSGCNITLLPDRNKHDRRYIFQIDFSGVLDVR